MRFDFFPVKPEDLEELIPKTCYSIGELGCSKDLIALSCLQNTDSISMGFGLADGTLLGICGSYRQWEGAAQAWAVFDARVELHPRALYMACEQLIQYAQAKQGLRRLSLTVKSGYTKGNRFASALGFSFEGKLYGYLPGGDDAHLYARLF